MMGGHPGPLLVRSHYLHQAAHDGWEAAWVHASMIQSRTAALVRPPPTRLPSGFRVSGGDKG
jgi:hypothetical protein